jgi:hypothetical protein
MAARVTHFMKKVTDPTALCGADIDKRDSNWSRDIDAVTCKKCIKKIEEQGLNAVEKMPMHFISDATPRKTRAACGVKIKTETDTDYTVQRDGVTCTDCLKAMKPKHRKDKPALRHFKKVRKHAEKYLSHVAQVGMGSHGPFNDEQAVRIKHAEDLCGVIDAIIEREKEGWLTTVA